VSVPSAADAFSAHAVVAAFPGVSIELLDGSERMLAEATGRLGDAVRAVHVADMAAPLPDGRFDAIVSALAIHHLEDADKRRLFARAQSALRPGGVFVNAEQVTAPTLALTDVDAAGGFHHRRLRLQVVAVRGPGRI
jgi:tRNA (cmo5U34)-methyltransferase